MKCSQANFIVVSHIKEDAPLPLVQPCLQRQRIHARDRFASGINRLTKRNDVLLDFDQQAPEWATIGIASLHLDPRLGHFDIDLRPATMDQHGPDPNGVEQQYVLCQAPHPIRVGHRQAAHFYDDRLAGEAANVGQRLDQDASGFVDGDHEVAAFSLM